MNFLMDEVCDVALSSTCDKDEIRASLVLRTFSMDHIMENVFSRLSRNAALNCRFVSHRWAVLGSQEAQKQIPWFICVRYHEHPYTGLSRLCCERKRRLFLSDLIPLMSNSTSGFPCNSLIICSSLFHHPVVQQFLNVHGGHIKKLRLTQPADIVKIDTEYTHGYELHTHMYREYKQTITFSNLMRLLLNQCPNVQIFECNARIEAQADENPQMDIDTDNDELAAMVWRSKEGNPDFKFHFKVFEMKNRSIFPEKLLGAILLCSPHLKQVLLEHCNLHCLIQPANHLHLHLLKKFSICQNDLADSDCLKALDHVLKHAEGNWAVHELFLDGSCLFDKPHLWSRATRIVNRILQDVSASCTNLVYKGFEFLEGIQLPQMRTVECLSLFVRKGFKTLPEGITLGDTFPNLRSLTLSCEYPCDGKCLLLDVFNSLQPMPGVKDVRLSYFKNPEFAEGVRGLFPTAQVKDNYYMPTIPVPEDRWRNLYLR